MYIAIKNVWNTFQGYITKLISTRNVKHLNSMIISLTIGTQHYEQQRSRIGRNNFSTIFQEKRSGKIKTEKLDV